MSSDRRSFCKHVSVVRVAGKFPVPKFGQNQSNAKGANAKGSGTFFGRRVFLHAAFGRRKMSQTPPRERLPRQGVLAGVAA